LLVPASVVLWTLTGFAEPMRCELNETTAGYTLSLRMGDKVILTELWQCGEQAKGRAVELRARLLVIGWIERAG
jgi:hypothetical protein